MVSEELITYGLFKITLNTETIRQNPRFYWIPTIIVFLNKIQ